MKIAGIVAEYNPFHNGHAFQLEETRKAGATHLVAVMGGNFLQRGCCAQFEKHVRCEAALRCGADLVLELPLSCAMAGAERFAQGALELLRALGCISLVSFGSESPLAQLRPLAELLCGNTLDAAIRRHLSFGCTYAKARQAALCDVVGPAQAQLIALPNNILALEYLKAAQRLSFTPAFLAIPRKGAAHDAMQAFAPFASASFLREAFDCTGLAALRPYVPKAAFACYCAAAQEARIPASPAQMEAGILAVLRRFEKEEFLTLPGLSEGLENRLQAAVRSACNLEDLYSAVKSKRYPAARVRRLVFSAYLGLTEEDVHTSPPYLRVLGFNRRGEEILKVAKKTASLPLSGSLKRLEEESAAARRFAHLEARSGDLYSLTLPTPRPCGYDYTCKPVFFKEH